MWIAVAKYLFIVVDYWAFGYYSVCWAIFVSDSGGFVGIDSSWASGNAHRRGDFPCYPMGTKQYYYSDLDGKAAWYQLDFDHRVCVVGSGDYGILGSDLVGTVSSDYWAVPRWGSIKKQLQSLTFFVGLLSLIERLIFVRGKMYDGVRFFLFFKKRDWQAFILSYWLAMTFEKQPLPYAKGALAPYISEETMSYHYDKHHQAYVDNLNKLIVGTEFEGLSLEEIVKKSSGAIFNNAAQHWNHNFFRGIMSPNFAQMPSGKLNQDLDQSFGSFEGFKEQFIAAAVGNFGSGRTWLIKTTDGQLKILNTSNADNPLTKPETEQVLLGVDVWEHAYYIDTRNNRAQYLQNFFQVINWDLISQNYA